MTISRSYELTACVLLKSTLKSNHHYDKIREWGHLELIKAFFMKLSYKRGFIAGYGLYTCNLNSQEAEAEIV